MQDMVTEIMGGLIIAGALLVLIARWHAGRQQASVQDHQGMQAATARLKQELERSGNEIISRMGTHVNHLEDLIYEAEEKKKELRGQILQLQQWQQSIQEQLAEQHRMSQQLAQQMESLQMRQRQVSAAVSAMPMEAEVERVDAQDFASVLQQSIERDEREAAAQTEDVPLPEEMEAEPVLSEEDKARAANSAKARGLLLSGWSVEDVARETGLGKGAVELLQQMTKHQMA